MSDDGIAAFRPAPGTAHPHVQTVLAHVLRRRTPPPCVRVSLATPDGDHVEVTRLRAPRGAPTIVVVHGLEGSPSSGYVVEIMHGAAARGIGVAAIACRGCGRRGHRVARSYHAGETGDLGLVLAQLARDPDVGTLGAVGVSLGGSIVLGHLAEAGDTSPLTAAVAISVPFDLAAAARALDTGRGMTTIYRRRFLTSLHAKAASRAVEYPGTAWADAPGPGAGLVAFDDRVVAPVHGFAGAADYYARCSAGPRLAAVRRPTLLVSSADDPLVPAHTFPAAAIAGNPALRGVLTTHGGHAGFVAGTVRRPRFWAEETALDFLRLLG